jgi:Tat protein translocase TatB subunit
MQMFGIGIPELILILLLAVIVVGPDRLPQFAADLARWIRQTRAYLTHVSKDFNDVVKEFEQEAGATREDWKEIASVVGLHTREVVAEVQKVSTQIESANTPELKTPATANVVSFDSTARREEMLAAEAAKKEDEPSPDATEEDETAAEDRPWYVPERSPRRRTTE